MPPPSDPFFFVGGNAHSGRYAAWFGTVGNVDEMIWESFDTVPGEQYSVEFWLAHGSTNSQNDFSVIRRMEIGSYERFWPTARFFMKRLTREWVGKAEDDYQAAHRLKDESRRFHDQICFHCQQSTEK